MKESTRTPDFLKRTAMASLWTGLLLGLGIAWKWDWSAASGFVLALVWGLANFAVLAAIMVTVTAPSGIRVGRLIGLVALKLIGLYALMVWVLLHRWFPLPAFVAGFTWILAVVLLRALGSLTVKTGLQGPGSQSVS